MLLPGIGFTSASCSASWTMNGVSWMFSAGSNQAGTSVMCTPQVICPLGVSARAGTHETPRISARVANSVASRVTVVSLSLEPYVLVRRGIRIAADEAEPGILHPRPEAAQDGRLPERRDHRL